MLAELARQNDRRILGDADYYESMPYANERQAGYHQRYLDGQIGKAGWVHPDDYETDPIE